MHIIHKSQLDISPIDEEKSIILYQGKATKNEIKGVVLELCVSYKSWYLVFMTDDTPFEEMLHIHLLDEHFNTLDSITIGAMYSTGSFKNYHLIQPDRISFHFIGGTEWSVEILDKSKFVFPFISSIKGVHRKPTFRHYLNIYGNPQSEP